MDSETHIYTEGLVETLCGEKNDKENLHHGYFFSKDTAMFWKNSHNTIQVNKGPIEARFHGMSPLGRLPELGEGNNYIVVPTSTYRYRTSIMLMCNDCMALQRLRELE